MSYKDMILADAEVLREDVQEVRDKCDEVRLNCPSILRYLVDPTLDPIYDDMDAIIDYINEILDRLGDAELIRQIALDWKTWGDEMALNGTEISASGTNLPALDSWEDNGSVYHTVAEQHHEAVANAVPDVAYVIHDQLEDMAQHLENYWKKAWEFIWAVIGAVAGLIAAVAAVVVACLATGVTAGVMAWSIAGAIAGVVAAVAAFGDLPGKWDAIWAELDGITVDAVTELDDIRQTNILTNTAFDRGEWPPHFVVA